MNTRFSVAMCTYNGARFVGEQLASIAAQTRPPDELIVCDDHSTDETVQLVEQFAASAAFPVRLQVNEQNLGSTKNFAQAIGLCKGDLIALADQDDVWMPHKLERLEAEFLRAPDVGLVFSDAIVVDDDTQPIGIRLWDRIGFDRREREGLLSGNILAVLLNGSVVTGATMSLRARFTDLVLPIPTEQSFIHDGWIAIVIGCVARLTPIEEPLIMYRQHVGQQVGALEREVTIGGLSAVAAGETREALHRHNPYSAVIAVLRAVRQRLLEKRKDDFEAGDCQRQLEARISHLEARSSLPSSLLLRAGVVLRELLSLRYSRYSNGTTSAAKDLVYGSRLS